MENNIGEPEIKYVKCKDTKIESNGMNWIACVIDFCDIISIFVYNCDYSNIEKAYTLNDYIGGVIIIGENKTYLYVNYKKDSQNFDKKIYYKNMDSWLILEDKNKNDEQTTLSNLAPDLINQNRGKRLIENIEYIGMKLSITIKPIKEGNRPSRVEANNLHLLYTGFVPDTISINNLYRGISTAKKNNVPKIKSAIVNFDER